MHAIMQSKGRGQYEECSPTRTSNFNVFMVLFFVQPRSVLNNLDNNKYKWCKVMGGSHVKTKWKQHSAQINTKYYARMTVKHTVSNNITLCPFLHQHITSSGSSLLKENNNASDSTQFGEPVSNIFLKPAGLQKVVHRTKSFHFKHHWQCTCYLQHI